MKMLFVNGLYLCHCREDSVEVTEMTASLQRYSPIVTKTDVSGNLILRLQRDRIEAIDPFLPGVALAKRSWLWRMRSFLVPVAFDGIPFDLEVREGGSPDGWCRILVRYVHCLVDQRHPEWRNLAGAMLLSDDTLIKIPFRFEGLERQGAPQADCKSESHTDESEVQL